MQKKGELDSPFFLGQWWVARHIAGT